MLESCRNRRKNKILNATITSDGDVILLDGEWINDLLHPMGEGEPLETNEENWIHEIEMPIPRKVNILSDIIICHTGIKEQNNERKKLRKKLYKKIRK